MKKNAMLKIAAILLVAVLLTTCAISSTFAKYATSEDADTQARVAKFGVTVTTNLDDLFGQYYYANGTKDPTDATKDIGDTPASSATSATVVADAATIAAEGKVFAPGTKNTLQLASTVSGTPEVSVSIGYEATLLFDGWEIATNTEYCPIVFTVGSTDYKIETGETINDLKEKVEEAIEAYEYEYAAGTTLNGEGKTPITIGWSWPIGDDDATNEKDTKLGDLAAAGDASTVTLTIETTVTQVD